MSGAVALLVLLLVLLGIATGAAALREDPAPVAPVSARLVLVQRRTRRWRWAGLLVGALVAVAAVHQGALGRGVLLATPLFAVCVVAGVIVGELRVAPPTGPTRQARLEVRRVRDYVPRRLGMTVAVASGLFAVVLAATTASGAPDDLGRAGRALVRRCSALHGESRGPWPGSYYSVPLAVIVVGGLLTAAVALSLVVRRPRQGEDPAIDDALRVQAAQAVTAASGLLVALPFAGINIVAAAAMLGIGCRPTWWTVVGWGLLLLAVALLALAAWCASVLAYPTGVRSRRVESAAT